jgi:hypothetical protein
MYEWQAMTSFVFLERDNKAMGGNPGNSARPGSMKIKGETRYR